MSNKYRAIVRKKPSVPMRILSGILIGDCLDYGCGRGFDAEYYGMDGYDKHWFPTRPSKLYDVITCHYVLNVVDEIEQGEILLDIKSLLSPSGVCFITVRRDIKESYYVKDYVQRVVQLPFNIHYEEKNRFVIYKCSFSSIG